MKPGTQIVYVPHHVNGNIFHKDCQYGFVTSISKGGTEHFCRYWLKGEIGRKLRTVANSELTPNDCLQEYHSANQKRVDEQLDIILKGEIK